MCGEMPVVIEMAKHHYAHACKDFNCNVVLPSYDGSVCPRRCWELGNAGASCDTVCSSCSDGDWGVSDEASFRAALAAAGEDAEALCGGGFDGWDWDVDPGIDSSDNSCWWMTGASTNCSASHPTTRRLCRCSPVLPEPETSEICACAATEPDHPFSLDCHDRAAIAASAAKLESADCVASTEGCDVVVDGMMPCRGAYFHIHYIHGWCPDGSMLYSEEQTLHDYEAHCPMCLVERPHNSAHPVCPEVNCTDVAAAEAQALILSSGSANGGTACGNDADGTGGDGTCCRNAEEIAAWRKVL